MFLKKNCIANITENCVCCLLRSRILATRTYLHIPKLFRACRMPAAFNIFNKIFVLVQNAIGNTNFGKEGKKTKTHKDVGGKKYAKLGNFLFL